MMKRDELFEEDSCLNKAGLNEMIFVLRAHDITAPATIRFWVRERIASGKNQSDDIQIKNALDCANEMEWQQKKGI